MPPNVQQLALVALACSIAAADARIARASCAPSPVREVELVVASCRPADTAKTRPSYAGVVVTGQDRLRLAAVKAWIPASEGVSCAVLKKDVVLEGKLRYACCDGDPNPPCLLAFSEILSGVKLIAAQAGKPAKPAKP